MPIRWYGPANPDDPTYRHFERIVNVVLHGGIFAAVNSGLWFVQGIRHPWSHLAWLTEIWAVLLLAQLVSVVVQRPKASAESTSAGPS
jgi:hydrogenase/urease accessory protein HupE